MESHYKMCFHSLLDKCADNLVGNYSYSKNWMGLWQECITERGDIITGFLEIKVEELF
jgi:hypothetical protein